MRFNGRSGSSSSTTILRRKVEGTVGIALSITHEAPTPLGATVTAKAIVSAVEGRKSHSISKLLDGH